MLIITYFCLTCSLLHSCGVFFAVVFYPFFLYTMLDCKNIGLLVYKFFWRIFYVWNTYRWSDTREEKGEIIFNWICFLYIFSHVFYVFNVHIYRYSICVKIIQLKRVSVRGAITVILLNTMRRRHWLSAQQSNKNKMSKELCYFNYR